MKLYISGPITGIELNNEPAFQAAQERLEAAGYEVVNPHKLGPQSGYQHGLRWSDYLRADFTAILTDGVNGIATIEGWYRSPGALFECETSMKLDLTVGPEEFWISLSKGI